MRGFKNTRPALFAGPPTRPNSALATVRRIRSRSRNLLLPPSPLFILLQPRFLIFLIFRPSTSCLLLSNVFAFLLPFCTTKPAAALYTRAPFRNLQPWRARKGRACEKPVGIVEITDGIAGREGDQRVSGSTWK